MLEINGARIRSEADPAAVRAAGFELAWTDPEMVEELLAGVRGASSHGLDPADHHEAILTSGWPAAPGAPPRSGVGGTRPPPHRRTRRLAFTLHYGKSDPKQLIPVEPEPRFDVEDPAGIFALV